MEQRIIAIEEKLAHLERYVEQLDATVRELYDRLDLQGKDLTRLREDTQTQFNELDRPPEDDKPPHWGSP